MNGDLNWSSIARQRAEALASRLQQGTTDRVVFAESCTCGLVAALLGQIPGISNWLCGSAVTYRESVKQQWLAVSADTLAAHTAESFETTREMAIGVLKKTSDAAFAAAVTGHLGPDASPDIDGKIFVAVAVRGADEPTAIRAETYQLSSSSRVDRQHEAACRVYELLIVQLESG